MQDAKNFENLLTSREFSADSLGTLGESIIILTKSLFLWHLTFTNTIKLNVKNKKMSFLDSQTCNETVSSIFNPIKSLAGGASISECQN